MAFVLFMLAAVLFWFGVEALMLARHASPPTQLEKDELMLEKGHRRPVPDYVRSFVQRRYPFAGSANTTVYGLLFLAAGAVTTWLAWESWT